VPKAWRIVLGLLAAILITAVLVGHYGFISKRGGGVSVSNPAQRSAPDSPSTAAARVHATLQSPGPPHPQAIKASADAAAAAAQAAAGISQGN
jgi:hypothetical protein